MKMNMSQYRKVHEDDKTATFAHEKGHKIQVDKSSLSPRLKSQLAALPLHMADGGDVADDISVDSGPAAAFSPATLASAAGDVGNALGDIGNSFTQAMSRGAPTPAAPDTDEPQMSTEAPKQVGFDVSQIPQPESPQVPQQAPQPQSPQQVAQPQGTQGYGDAYQKAVNDQMMGIYGNAAADTQQARAESAALKQGIDKQQRLAADFQTSYKEQLGHIDDLIHDAQQGHFNANEYLDNMGTGKKIRTTIGMLLSGAFAGMTGAPNMAVNMLNQQIERNLEQQKQNFGQKQTILEANFKKFGNMRDAMQMTQAMDASLVAMQLKKAAADSNDPRAKAAALAAGGKLMADYIPKIQEMSMRQAAMKGAMQGDMDPAQLVRYLVPEAHQKEVFHEIGQAQNVRNNSGKLLELFDQAAKENTIARTGAGLLRTPGSVMGLHQLMLPNFKTIDGTVRQAAMDESFKNLTPAPGDNDAKIAYKRQALINWMNSESTAPTSKGYGIDLDKYPSTSTRPEMKLTTSQAQYLQWAKAQPSSNPKAQAVFKQLGINR